MEKAQALKIEEIWAEKNSAKIWDKLRDLAPDIGKSKNDADNFAGILNPLGETTTDDGEIAEIHAKNLECAHGFPVSATFDENFRQEVDKSIRRLQNNNNSSSLTNSYGSDNYSDGNSSGNSSGYNNVGNLGYNNNNRINNNNNNDNNNSYNNNNNNHNNNNNITPG